MQPQGQQPIQNQQRTEAIPVQNVTENGQEETPKISETLPLQNLPTQEVQPLQPAEAVRSLNPENQLPNEAKPDAPPAVPVEARVEEVPQGVPTQMEKPDLAVPPRVPEIPGSQNIMSDFQKKVPVTYIHEKVEKIAETNPYQALEEAKKERDQFIPLDNAA